MKVKFKSYACALIRSWRKIRKNSKQETYYWTSANTYKK